MSLTQLLFSFQGRLNRQPYWLIGIAIAVVMALMLIFAVTNALLDDDIGGSTLAILVIFGLLYIPAIWIGFAIGAKRLHDRDKSAWWLLVFYILPSVLSQIGYQMGILGGLVFSLASLAVAIWAFVELGCLRGTRGPNRYGPDPLAKSS
jgi:uncharacterized membrane protein YhaH (DUF805 family)